MAEDKKLRILSALSLTESQVEKIKAVDPRIEVHWYGRKDATRIPMELWREAEILITSGTNIMSKNMLLTNAKRLAPAAS